MHKHNMVTFLLPSVALACILCCQRCCNLDCCRPVTLSILADLLADKRSLPFFMEWHSPSRTAATPAAIGTAVTGTPSSPSRAPRPAVINAVQLLLSIWREQDQARGLTGPDGVLANPSRPLAGLGERTKWRLSDMGGSGGYVHLESERKQQIEKIQAASSTDLLMDKVGVGAVGECITCSILWPGCRSL